MAITFEEENNNVRNIIVVAVMALIMFVVVFFVWKFAQEAQTPASPVAVNVVQIKKGILNDPRLTALDLFPEIPAVDTVVVRVNPFVEATTTESVAENATVANTVLPE